MKIFSHNFSPMKSFFLPEKKFLMLVYMPLMSFMKCIFLLERRRGKTFFFWWEFSCSEKNFLWEKIIFLICGKTKTWKLSEKSPKLNQIFLNFHSKNFSLKFSKIWLKIPQHPSFISQFSFPAAPFSSCFYQFLFILSHHTFIDRNYCACECFDMKKMLSLLHVRFFLCLCFFLFLVHLILPKKIVFYALFESILLFVGKCRIFLSVPLLDEIRMDVINVGLVGNFVRINFKWWMDYFGGDMVLMEIYCLEVSFIIYVFQKLGSSSATI